MVGDSARLSHRFAGRAVQLIFAVLLSFWGLLALGWLPESFYAPLSPFWIPSYFAFAAASGMRNTVFPWLGGGLLFDVATILFMYIESVILAGLFRIMRTGYQTYRQGHEEQAGST